MLNDAMRRAGWRPAPNEKVRGDWKARNGAWMVKTPSGPILADFAALMWKFEVLLEWPWRPVSTQTWDYDPRGWGVVVPTKKGVWWWRRDVVYPCYIAQDGPNHPLQWFEKSTVRGTGKRRQVMDDGQWLAPCVKPEVVG